MEQKTSITLYRKYKTEIKEITYMDNDEISSIIFRCRSNTLRLNDRNRFTGGDTKCPLCQAEIEDLAHFILDCPEYRTYRKNLPKKNQNVLTREEEIASILLLQDPQNQDIKKDMIKKMWNHRNKEIKKLIN